MASIVNFRNLAAALSLGALVAGAAVLAAPSEAAAQSHRFVGGFHGGFVHGGFGRFHGGFGVGFVGPGCCWGGWGWPYWGAAYWPYYYPGYTYAYPYPYVAYVPAAATVAPPPPPPVAAVHRHFVVYFDFDKADLTRDGSAVVDAAIAEAKRGGPSQIQLTGNTDTAGTNSYNMELSEHRAETVRDYMVSRGIPRGDIEIRALGKSDPAVRTADGVREPRNRRVEIVITPHRNVPVASGRGVPLRAGYAPAPNGTAAGRPSSPGQPTSLVPTVQQ